MYEGLYISASAGNKQQKKLEVVSNNLANVSTPGFKKDQLVFEALMPPFPGDPTVETARNTLLAPGQANKDTAYVSVVGQATTFTPGTFLKTENPLDIAIEGDAFIEIDTPAGPRYTRKGSFRLDELNRLVTKDGNLVRGQSGQPIVIDSFGSPIKIDLEGQVGIVADTQTVAVDNLKLVQFQDNSQLIKEGNGLYRKRHPDIESRAPTDFRVRQGFVESSNVSVVEEMNNLVLTLRTFEAYQTVIQNIDRIDNQSINTLGRSV